MTFFVLINDVDETDTSIRVSGFQAISTFDSDPLIPGELTLECREGSATGVSQGFWNQFVTVGQGGDTPKLTVNFPGLKWGTTYYLIGRLINTSTNQVVASKERIVTTTGTSTELVYGDLSAAMAVSGITKESAKATVTITNRTSKSGNFNIVFEFRDSTVAIYSEVVSKSIGANGSISHDFVATLFEPGKTYSARALAANASNSPLSTLASKVFTTLKQDGTGGGNVTDPPADLRQYAIAASVGVLALLALRR
jgi:hypothetical protein